MPAVVGGPIVGIVGDTAPGVGTDLVLVCIIMALPVDPRGRIRKRPGRTRFPSGHRRMPRNCSDSRGSADYSAFCGGAAKHGIPTLKRFRPPNVNSYKAASCRRIV